MSSVSDGSTGVNVGAGVKVGCRVALTGWVKIVAGVATGGAAGGKLQPASQINQSQHQNRNFMGLIAHEVRLSDLKVPRKQMPGLRNNLWHNLSR